MPYLDKSFAYKLGSLYRTASMVSAHGCVDAIVDIPDGMATPEQMNTKKTQVFVKGVVASTPLEDAPGFTNDQTTEDVWTMATAAGQILILIEGFAVKVEYETVPGVQRKGKVEERYICATASRLFRHNTSVPTVGSCQNGRDLVRMGNTDAIIDIAAKKQSFWLQVVVKILQCKIGELRATC